MAQKNGATIRILELHSNLGIAGGPRNMVGFAVRLDSDVCAVHAGGYRAGGPREQVLRDADIPTVVGDGTAEPILSYIKAHGIDVIHMHRSGHTVPLESEILLGAKKINPEIVIIEKNVFGKYDPICDEIIDCHFFQSMMHLNERYLSASGRPFDPTKMKVLYNMVPRAEFEQYRMSDDEVAAYKASLGIGSDDVVIGKIGRPHIAKWSDLILDMMPYLTVLVPNVKVIIQSVPESRLARINRAPWKDAVIALPQTEHEAELHRFYQTIDILAHSSKIGECNGNTINEAMFWKKPVVVNSTPHRDNGQLEQVIHGETGYIANHPQTYARAVAHLSADRELANNMGEQGYQRVTQINDPDSITRQVEKKIYEALVALGDERAALLCDRQEISYTPSEEEVQRYKLIYQERVRQEFGVLSVRERLWNTCRQPLLLWRKIQDYREAKV